MSRSSRQNGDHIVMDAWLCFTEAGELRLTRTRPGLGRGERVAFLQLKAPLSLWRTPEFRLEVEIENNGAPLETAKKLAAAIRDYAGIEVRIEPIATATITTAPEVER